MRICFTLLFILISLVSVQAQQITSDTATANILARTADLPIMDTTSALSDLPEYTNSPLKLEVFMEEDSSRINPNILEIKTEAVNDSIDADSAAMYARGEAEALKYHKFKGAFWASTISSLFFPLGYVVPISIALVKPKINPAHVPDIELLQQNKHYVRGYEKQAHKRKIGNAAAGAGIGSGIFIVFTLLLISALGPL